MSLLALAAVAALVDAPQPTVQCPPGFVAPVVQPKEYPPGVTPIHPEEVRQFPQGTCPAPPPANWTALVDAYLDGSLKDPYSAQKQLRRGPRWATLDRKPLPLSGWTVCYWVNAKNSYGAYVGRKAYLFVLNDESVVDAIAADGEADWSTAGLVEAECSRAADPPLRKAGEAL